MRKFALVNAYDVIVWFFISLPVVGVLQENCKFYKELILLMLLKEKFVWVLYFSFLFFKKYNKNFFFTTNVEIHYFCSKNSVYLFVYLFNFIFNEKALMTKSTKSKMNKIKEK